MSMIGRVGTTGVKNDKSMGVGVGTCVEASTGVADGTGVLMGPPPDEGIKVAVGVGVEVDNVAVHRAEYVCCGDSSYVGMFSGPIITYSHPL